MHEPDLMCIWNFIIKVLLKIIKLLLYSKLFILLLNYKHCEVELQKPSQWTSEHLKLRMREWICHMAKLKFFHWQLWCTSMLQRHVQTLSLCACVCVCVLTTEVVKCASKCNGQKQKSTNARPKHWLFTACNVTKNPIRLNSMKQQKISNI